MPQQGAALQDMRRVVAERLPVVATCAEELAAMQCAALSCLGAAFAAYTCIRLPAATLSKVGAQGANLIFSPKIGGASIIIWYTSCKATSGEQDFQYPECIGNVDSYRHATCSLAGCVCHADCVVLTLVR